MYYLELYICLYICEGGLCGGGYGFAFPYKDLGRLGMSVFFSHA